MQGLIYLMAASALLYWVGLFWCRAFRWVILHGRETRRKLEMFRDAAVAAYREEP